MNSASRTRMRSPVLIAGSLLLTAFLARPTAADEPEAKPAQTSGAYAGAASCTDCHEDQVHALAKTPHGKQAFADLAAHGCETCHGALADHVKSPNNKKFRPPKPSAMTPEEQVALCQACHTGGKQMLWNGSAHAGEPSPRSRSAHPLSKSFDAPAASNTTPSKTPAALPSVIAASQSCWKVPSLPLKKICGSPSAWSISITRPSTNQ